MANQEIRELAIREGIKLWQIADKLGINDGNLSRKLRHELSEVDKKRVIQIINELKQEE